MSVMSSEWHWSEKVLFYSTYKRDFSMIFERRMKYSQIVLSKTILKNYNNA